MTPPLPSDLERQLLAVSDAVPRLLALQDDDALSPSRGSFHVAFWRDKTSDVMDARLQTAAPALLLLVEARALAPYAPDEPLRSRALRAALAGVDAWVRAQYPEGCFDAWYRGERSFSATAATSLAMALALRHLDDAALTPGLRSKLDEALRRASTWLSEREEADRPHQMATAAAALAIIGRQIDDEACLFAARRKLEAVLSLQSEEGWFLELGAHADVGATFRLIESLSLYAHESGDWSCLGQIERAFEFATTYLHPGATTGAEYGVSRDDYVSRLAIVLLAGKLPRAARLLEELARLDADEIATPAYLLDDYWLCRSAPLPILTLLYHRELAPSIEANRAALQAEADGVRIASVRDEPLGASPGAMPELRHHRRAGILSVCHGRRRLIVAPAAGGVLRVFDGAPDDVMPRTLLLEDFGYRFDPEDAGRPLTTRHQSSEPRYAVHDNGDCIVVSMHLDFAAARYFFPTYWSRFLLRLASSTRRTSRWTRRYINWFRRRARTALVQAAPPRMIEAPPTLRLERTVTIHAGGRVEIDDVLSNIGAAPIAVAEGRLRGLTGVAPADYNASAQESIAVARLLQPGVALTITRSLDEPGDAAADAATG